MLESALPVLEPELECALLELELELGTLGDTLAELPESCVESRPKASERASVGIIIASELAELDSPRCSSIIELELDAVRSSKILAKKVLFMLMFTCNKIIASTIKQLATKKGIEACRPVASAWNKTFANTGAAIPKPRIANTDIAACDCAWSVSLTAQVINEFPAGALKPKPIPITTTPIHTPSNEKGAKKASSQRPIKITTKPKRRVAAGCNLFLSDNNELIGRNNTAAKFIASAGKTACACVNPWITKINGPSVTINPTIPISKNKTLKAISIRNGLCQYSRRLTTGLQFFHSNGTRCSSFNVSWTKAETKQSKTKAPIIKASQMSE